MKCMSLVILLAACGGSHPAKSPAQPPPVTSAPTAGGDLPIAQYLGSDDLTGERVRELLAASHIESSAGGSRGYSVWVAGADRAKAREILLAAVTSECLAVTLFDDHAVPMPVAVPARCTPAQPPAAPDTSK